MRPLQDPAGFGPPRGRVAQGTGFRRVFPTQVSAAASPGVDFGPTLSCLRFLSRAPPGSPVICGQAYSLWLDPAATAPNAVVGVSLSGSRGVGDYAILRPGDGLEVPQGFDRFYCYNADYADLYFDLVNQPANAPLGYCGFLIGLDPGSRPTFPHPRRSVGPAHLIQACALPSTTPSPFRQNAQLAGFTCNGLRAIRVSVAGIRADGGIVTSTSAGVAFVIAAFWSRWRNLGTLGLGAGAFAPLATETLDSTDIVGAGNEAPMAAQQRLLPLGFNSMPAIAGASRLYSANVFEVPRGATAGVLTTPTTGFQSYIAAVPITSLTCLIEGIGD